MSISERHRGKTLARWLTATAVGAALAIGGGARCRAQDAGPPEPAPAPSAPARDPAAARALFLEGLSALEANDWATACAKFDASMSLNPAVSALLNVAKCREHDGKLTDALAAYQNASILNKDTAGAKQKSEAAEFIDKAIAALEPRIPKLRIMVTDPPPNVIIRRDGATVPLAAAGELLPTNPGRHEITVEAPGFLAQRYVVVLAEGGRAEVEAALTKIDVPAPVAPPEPVKPVVTPAAAKPPEPTRCEQPSCNCSGWLAIAGGLLLWGGGTAFAIDAKATQSDIVAKCGSEGKCDTSVLDQTEADALNGRKYRDIGLAIALFATGAAAATTGTVLLIRGRTASATAINIVPWAAPGGIGALAGGRF